MSNWLPIPGFPIYEVSDDGQVRSVERITPSRRGEFRRPTKTLAQHTSAKGYRNVCLYDGERSRRHQVHRLVALAFYGPSHLQVRHLNGHPADNRLENLVYGTNAQNQQDSLEHGTQASAAKTHCKRGHEFNEANTYRYVTAQGRTVRNCRACRRK